MKKYDYIFEKVIEEAKKIHDLDSLKKELKKLTNEIKNLKKPLNKKAKQQLKELEKKYSYIFKNIVCLQKQVDIELAKAVKSVNVFKKQAEAMIKSSVAVALEQKNRVSDLLSQKIAGNSPAKQSKNKKTPVKKRVVKKKATKVRVAKKKRV